MAGWFINEDGEPYWYTGTEEEQAMEYPGDVHGALPDEDTVKAVAEWLDRAPKGVWAPTLTYRKPDGDEEENTYSLVIHQHIRYTLQVDAESPEAALAQLQMGSWDDTNNEVLSDTVQVFNESGTVLLLDTEEVRR